MKQHSLRYREHPLIAQNYTENYFHVEHGDLFGKASDVLHNTVAESWCLKPIFQAVCSLAEKLCWVSL